MDLVEAKRNAIYAGAYNECGPKCGEGARPSTVRNLVDAEELKRLLKLYRELIVVEADVALHSVEEVDDAFNAL